MSFKVYMSSFSSSSSSEVSTIWSLVLFLPAALAPLDDFLVTLPDDFSQYQVMKLFNPIMIQHP